MRERDFNDDKSNKPNPVVAESFQIILSHSTKESSQKLSATHFQHFWVERSNCLKRTTRKCFYTEIFSEQRKMKSVGKEKKLWMKQKKKYTKQSEMWRKTRENAFTWLTHTMRKSSPVASMLQHFILSASDFLMMLMKEKLCEITWKLREKLKLWLDGTKKLCWDFVVVIINFTAFEKKWWTLLWRLCLWRQTERDASQSSNMRIEINLHLPFWQTIYVAP